MRNFLLSLLVYVAAFLSGTSVHATAQMGEILEWEGERHVVFAAMPVPNIDVLFAEKVLGGGGCTANWKGFSSGWRVSEGKLYLTAIYRGCSRDPVAADKLFPGRAWPIRADWFTGTLRLPKGKRIEYVHMGFASLYEKDVFLKFIGGHLIERREVDYTEVPAVKAYLALIKSCGGDSAWDCEGKVLESNQKIIENYQQWRRANDQRMF